MKKDDCLRWAKALINGNKNNFRGKMGSPHNSEEKPSELCCLGVANELFNIEILTLLKT
jgi:dihydroorotase